MGVQVKL